MANLTGLVKQLKKERDKVAGQLSALDAALTAFVGVYSLRSSKYKSKTRTRRKMSRAARARIAAAQRARWAKVRAKQKK